MTFCNLCFIHVVYVVILLTSFPYLYRFRLTIVYVYCAAPFKYSWYIRCFINLSFTIVVVIVIVIIMQFPLDKPSRRRNINTNPTPRTEAATQPVAEVMTSPPFRSSSCGMPVYAPNIFHRIVGGSETKPHSWPWMAAIFVKHRFDDNTFKYLGPMCGASIVSSRCLVTAAHCMLVHSQHLTAPRSCCSKCERCVCINISLLEDSILHELPEKTSGFK